jgi:hypothetical protein
MKNSIIIILSILTLNSCETNKGKSNHQDQPINTIKHFAADSISIKFLNSVLFSVKNQENIQLIMSDGGFLKKSGIQWLSKRKISPSEHEQLIDVVSAGDYSTVYHKTTNKQVFLKLQKEIEEHAVLNNYKPKGVTTHLCKKAYTEDVEYETCEPKEGVNLSKNHYFEIILTSKSQ